MNVLELVQAAAAEINIQVPSSLITTGDAEVHWKHLLYSVSRDLRSTMVFPQQKRSHSITLSNGRSKYPLPADFYAGIIGTKFDQSNEWELIGPVSDGDWNYYLYGPGYGATRKMYRVFGPDKGQGSATAGGQLELHPTPSTTETISFDYVSATTILPPLWTASTVIAASSYRSANGNIYFTTAGGTTGTTPPSATSAVPVDGTVTWVYVSTAIETVSTNSDLSIFDDDIMIQGLKYMYKEANNQNASDAQRKFETMKANAAARWVGPYRGRFDKRPGRAPYSVRF